MKVCLLQSNPILGNLTQNFNWLKTQIKKQDADLFIAPEMALLGYPADDLISDNFFIEKQRNQGPPSSTPGAVGFDSA